MKKKFVKRNFILGSLQKILLVMAFKALIIFLTFNAVFANTFSQEKLDVVFEEETVENVLEYLQENTNYEFFYKRELLSGVKVTNVKMYDAFVEDILDEILKKNGLDYSIINGVVVVRKEEVIQTQQQKEITIRGRVTDKDKNPLIGVTVKLKGINVGTVTNEDGKYVLNLPQMDKFVIEFSFIGMESKEINYHGQDTIDVILNEDLKQIEEVVITGYQKIQKSEMVGSSNTINREDLFYNGTNSIEQMLQGKLPGMMVMNTDGLVGSRQKVRVRGTSTLLSNAEPVWVVDGIIQEDPVPFQTQELGNMGDNFDMIRNFIGNSIAWLNPNDIEDITVLKDAAATVMYGVKAANGVIIINTKRGKAGSLTVNYRSNFSFTNKLNYKKLNLMNSKERIDVSREIVERKLIKGYYSESVYIGYEELYADYLAKNITFSEFNNGVKKLEVLNTDWIDVLYRTPFSYNNSLSLSGGSENVRYYGSLSYNKKIGTAKGNDEEQYGASLSLTTYFNEKINVDLRLSGSIRKTESFYNGIDPFSYVLKTSRAIPAYDENSERYFYKKSEGYGYEFNIENEIQETGNSNEQRNLNLSLLLNYNILPSLRFESSFGLGTTNTVGESFASELSYYIATIREYNYGEYGVGDDRYRASKLPYGGELNIWESRNMSITWKNSLSYNLKMEKHNLSFYLGQEIRSTKTKGLNSINYGYLPDKGKIINSPPMYLDYQEMPNPIYNEIKSEINDSKNNYVSFYGNISYSYDDRYVLTIGARSDASNRFGQDSKSRFLPAWSIGGRWNVHNEMGINNDILSELNFRASYGWQGNVAENFGPDLIAYYPSPVFNNYVDEYQLKIRRLGYKNLRWEKTKNINLGVDLGLMRNRFTVTFEYYNKKTEDMIIEKEIPVSYGIKAMPVNGGNMSNRGIELNVNGTIIRSKDIVWSLSFNTSKNLNKLESDVFSTELWSNAVGGQLSKKGYPITSFWAFELKGLENQTGFPIFDIPTSEENPAIQTDATEYMKYMGKLEPDFTGGLSNIFRYKNFSISCNFYLSIGSKKFLNPMFSSGDLPSAYENMSKDFTKRWRKPGDENKTNIPGIPYYTYDMNTNGSTPPSILLPHSTYPVNTYDMYNYSDVRVFNASYFRFNNIAVTYDVNDKLLKQLKLKNLSLTASVTNPFIIMSKKFKGIDPEVYTEKQPVTKTYSLELSVSF